MKKETYEALKRVVADFKENTDWANTDFKIKLNKIWVTKPEMTEADGSKRAIYPIEARLRKITYGAPAFIEVSAYINDVERENFTTQIANIPIMLKSKFNLMKLNNKT